ncbi:MAG TPA: hypothetical protein VNY06_03950 [Methylocella sp.]|nr:hypothetical protein [Methylocella sp.]
MGQCRCGRSEDGPIPAVHGVVRWRLIDLAQWAFEEFRVSIFARVRAWLATPIPSSEADTPTPISGLAQMGCVLANRVKLRKS